MLETTSYDDYEILNSISGNIVPPNWYTIITTASNKPDRTAISILSEIVYWYRPRKIKPTFSNNECAHKFLGDVWQTSYEYLSKKFGCSKETVRRSLVKLETLGLISREFRSIQKFGQVYNNVLFVHLDMKKFQALLGKSSITSINSKNFYQPSHKILTPSPQTGGELYKEKEISYENNKIRSNESNFLKKNKNSLQCNLSELEKEIRVGGSFPSASLTRTPIAKFYPVSEEDAFYLQKASSRDFSRSYINKLLLKLIDIKPDHGFYTKDIFLSYMSKALSNELRNPTQTNNLDFSFAISKEVRVVEDYLNNIEASRHTDNITRLKKKIIGSFETANAYSILTKLTFDHFVSGGCDHSSEQITQTVKVSSSNTHSSTRSTFVLSKERQDVITRLVLEVFGQSTNVVFDLDHATQSSQNFEKSTAAISSKSLGQGSGDYHALPNTCFNPDNQHSADAISEPTTFEQKLLSLLKQSYGDTIYKSWFSMLKVRLEDADTSNTADQDSSSIASSSNTDEAKVSIITPTAFMRDYLKTNYGHKIESVIRGLLEKVDQRLSREGVVWV